jgi:HSP20 family protein
MTTLVRFDPYREVTALQGEMGRFLNLFGGGNGNTTPAVWAPAMDVWETDDEIVYAFDLPGIPKETVSIEVENGVLTVTAERERSQEVSADRLYRYERRYGSFSRTIGLPQGVSEDQISARYNNGVLEVHAKKAEVEKPRRIQISNGKAAIEGKTTKAEGTATRA